MICHTDLQFVNVFFLSFHFPSFTFAVSHQPAHQNAPEVREVKRAEQVSCDLSCDTEVANKPQGMGGWGGGGGGSSHWEITPRFQCVNWRVVLTRHTLFSCGFILLPSPDCPSWRRRFTSGSIKWQVLLSKFHTCRSTFQKVLAQQPRWTWTLSHHHSNRRAGTLNK